MPIEVTYPGVYVEELPSGNHTIAPVGTSITAFYGRAPIGPTDLPMTMRNFGDFQRSYGGLSFDYPLSYAVQDFFASGGSQAVIARLFEPLGGGDGVARLAFPPAPPALPAGWLLDGNVTAGATTIPISPPDADSEEEPDIGMLIAFGADTRTTYLVTDYNPATAKNPVPSVSIVPALAKPLRQCTPLTFTNGASPQGWTAISVNGASVTLTGGNGLPELGDTLSFAKDPVLYTIIAEPKVTGTTPDTLAVTVTLSGKPGSSGAVGIADPLALAMPVGWEVESATPGATPAQASLALINGVGAPQRGDRFTIGTDPTVYVVAGYAPLTAKAPDTIAITSLTGEALDLDNFCLCCAPIFQRIAPDMVAIKAGPKIGGTSFTAGSVGIGVIDIGDTFIVEGDATVYTVRALDGAGTVFFLPKAESAFGSSTGITFYPTLTLAAASPGEWGNLLTAQVDTQGITDKTAAQFLQYGLRKPDLFNLTLKQLDARGRTVRTERYLNLSVRAKGIAGTYPNRVDRVLVSDSTLARVARLSGMPPADGGIAQGLGGDDGTYLTPATYIGDQSLKTGLYMLENVSQFNLMCIPPDRRIFPEVPDALQDLDSAVNGAAARYCTNRRAFYIVDPPVAWKNQAVQGQIGMIDPSSLEITGMNPAGIEVERNAAVFFPRIWKEDLLMKSRPALFAPCGTIAGIMAATDIGRGVWKAPAGIDAGLSGVLDLEVNLTDDENGQLNPLGINCLRKFPVIGPVVWGSRTLRGADAFEDDYKYISVRRLTLFIEQSLIRGTQWAVFEPNNEALWSSLRLSVGGFLADLARQGAFYGYTVACDDKTTTAEDIALGKVNVLITLAPVEPAEFVVLQIQQSAGGAVS